MNIGLTAQRILTAAEAILGPRPRSWRASLLAEHEGFDTLPAGEVYALAARPR